MSVHLRCHALFLPVPHVLPDDAAVEEFAALSHLPGQGIEFIQRVDFLGCGHGRTPEQGNGRGRKPLAGQPTLHGFDEIGRVVLEHHVAGALDLGQGALLQRGNHLVGGFLGEQVGFHASYQQRGAGDSV